MSLKHQIFIYLFIQKYMDRRLSWIELGLDLIWWAEPIKKCHGADPHRITNPQPQDLSSPILPSTESREWNRHGHLSTVTSLFSYLALHHGRSRRWFRWWCSQSLFPSLHKALLCSQTRKEGCLAGVLSPLRHQQRTKDEKSTLLISLKMLILVVMGFEICWLFFSRVDRVNSEYRSSHPSTTDSKPSLGIKCIWYRTRRGQCRGWYDSAKSYRTRPIFWTLLPGDFPLVNACTG